MLSVSQWKAWNRLIQRRHFIEEKVRAYNNLPFYGMITRTNSFHCDLSRCISIGAHVLACAVYVLRIWFSKQKLGSSKRRFHWRILRGIIPVKTTRKCRHIFVWILLRCTFFVIRYIFWLKVALRHENLSIKT